MGSERLRVGANENDDHDDDDDYYDDDDDDTGAYTKNNMRVVMAMVIAT